MKDVITSTIGEARRAGWFPASYTPSDEMLTAFADLLLSKLRAEGVRAGDAVAYLDLGAGGYMDVGTDLTDEQLAALPKGRHRLAIIGTHGVDGHSRAAPASAPVADLTGWRMVPTEPTPEMLKAWHDTYSKAVVKVGRSSRAYAAMLEAAPHASAPVAGEAHEATKAAYERGRKKGNEEARSWPEDFSHENGNYMCKCHRCNQIFHGHKRRVTCKVCHAAPQASEALMVARAALVKISELPEVDGDQSSTIAHLGEPRQPIVTDARGVERFKENRIVSKLLEVASAQGWDMNRIAMSEFSDEDRRQFVQLIGYSVSGYGGLPYVVGE